MKRISILCEGKTEHFFADRLLNQHFNPRNAFISGIDLQGIGRSYTKARKQLSVILKDDRFAIVTTMLDYYALPSDFPGFEEATRLSSAIQRVESIESALLADIGEQHRFIPYIQLHEFEALLFSDVRAIQDAVDPDGVPEKLEALKEIVKGNKCPEEIDDGRETAPSKRLLSVFPYPSYQKKEHGPLIAGRIGLQKILSSCPHFRSWIERLEEAVGR